MRNTVLKFLLLFVAFTVVSTGLSAQGKDVGVRFTMDTIICQTNTLRVHIQARNLEGTAYNLASGSFRFQYNGNQLANPTVFNPTPTGGSHTIQQQTSGCTGDLITSYGILAFGFPLVALPANANWVTLGTIQFDIVSYVDLTNPNCLDLVWEVGAGVSCTPTVMQEYVSLFDQPGLNIIEFGNYFPCIPYVCQLPQLDTVYVTIPQNPATTPVCLDGSVIELQSVGSVSFCDPGTNVVGAVGSVDTCINLSPVPSFFGNDTMCVIHCDTAFGVCDTTIIISTVNPVLTIDTIPVTIPQDIPTTFCYPSVVDVPTVGSGTLCAQGADVTGTPSTNSGCITLDPTDGFTGYDTICVINCQQGSTTLCDTTIILITVVPTPDTLVVTTPPGTPVDTCLTGLLALPNGAGDVTVCQQGTNATVTTTNGDPCVSIAPGSVVGVDSLCVIVCDAVLTDICDTSIIVVIVTPPVDTIPVTIPNGTDSLVCINSVLQLPNGAGQFSICGQGPQITVAGTNNNSCVTVAAPQGYVGTQEVCVVFCDTDPVLATIICDTTILVVTSTPDIDTIHLTTTPGTPVDSCLVGPIVIELPSTVGATSVCSQGTQSTVTTVNGSNCIEVTPGPGFAGGSDTLCVIFCDATQTTICDTTIVIVTITVPTYPVDTVYVYTTQDVPTDTCLTSTTVQLPTVTGAAVIQNGTDVTATIGAPNNCINLVPTPGFVGVDTIVVVHNNGPFIADTTYIIVVVTPPVDTVPVTIPNGTDSVLCLNSVLQLPNGTGTFSICGQGTDITVAGTNADPCVTISAPQGFVGTQTVCVILCDSDPVLSTIICDTTFIVVTSTPDVDTIPLVTTPGTPVDTCLTAPVTVELPNGVGSATVCGQGANSTVTVTNNSNCITVTPNPGFVGGPDVLCVVFCDSVETAICDTTYITLTVLIPVDVDTVYIPMDSTANYCYGDLLQITGVISTTVFQNGTNVTATTTDTCMTITSTPGFVGVETIVIVSNNGTNNDTSIIVVVYYPPVDTFPVTFPAGTPSNPCLPSTVLQLPNIGDVVICDPGTNVTLTANDGDPCLTITPNPGFAGNDTLCVIFCDTISGVIICDTTIIPVTVVPVVDTIVITVPPGTPIDTCLTSPLITLSGPADTLFFCEPVSGNLDVVVTSTSCLTITPDSTFLGSDTLCVIICDGNVPPVCDTTIIIINSVLDPPTAVDDLDTTDVNTPVIVSVLGNDIVPGTLDTIYVSNNPSNGTATVNPNGTITYNPNLDFCGTDEFEYVICNLAGCDTATVTISITCPPPPTIIIYNAFSPNGDGNNETFTVENIEFYPDNELRIFNRWGSLVYETEGYLNTWDGKWEGKDLPDGTYYYILKVAALNETFTGYVQIARQFSLH